MKQLRLFYRFAGSVYFAIILIAVTAIFVIAGTFLEAATQSHRYAALFTFNSPFFALLLWGFFVNILFSATRRWPFQTKHIPFLTTHLGLLMLLSGVLIKHYFGVQGTMRLSEGTASQEIVEPNTYVVQIESKHQKPIQYSLKKTISGKHMADIGQNEDLSIQLVEYYPHCEEHLTSWIHGNYAFLAGLPPMLLVDADKIKKIPPDGTVHFEPPENHWNLYALKTSDISKTLEKLYARNAQINMIDRVTKKNILQESLQRLLQQKNNEIVANIYLGLNSSKEEISGNITIKYKENTSIKISLAGDHALLNDFEGHQLGSLPIALDIVQQPFFAIIQDDQENVLLFAVDPHGKIRSKKYTKGTPEILISYDNGFAGYTTKAELPLKAHPTGRQEREEALNFQLTSQLRKAMDEQAELSPPLQLIINACKKTHQEPAEFITDFLSEWNHSNTWLYPENLPLSDKQKQVFANIDWSQSKHAKQACDWIVMMFQWINPDLRNYENLLTALAKKNWPLLPTLEAEIAMHPNADETLTHTLLTQQLFAASDFIPPNADSNSEVIPEIQAQLLSAYLRAYGIHINSIIQIPSEEEMDQILLAHMNHKGLTSLKPDIQLESPVYSLSKPAIPLRKLEENRPKIKVFFSKKGKKQSISLAFDATGTGLKWPVLQGEYLTRFQPSFQEIPYRIRLRQAHQINYANSSQPYSFESDLIIKDQRSGEMIEKTISMNNVHETWDGYRFYLSSIAPSDETAVRHIQIVVNHDPAKYLLTYPGAAVLSCGIFMLFIMRPYRRKG